jgi:hypothetical protein
MTAMMLDPRHDARVSFDAATVKTRSSAKSAPSRHNPSSRGQLACRWHRTAEGLVICRWAHVPSTLEN